tara:strand:- start:172 stop:477 length:306 start_codon:yes stop_codon:yes gene_type:complete
VSKFYIIILFILIHSCGYPDIDTVPNFDSLKITKEESMIICKFNNKFKTERNQISKEYYELKNYDFAKGIYKNSRILNKTSFNLIGKEDCFREIKYLINRL